VSFGESASADESLIIAIPLRVKTFHAKMYQIIFHRGVERQKCNTRFLQNALSCNPHRETDDVRMCVRMIMLFIRRTSAYVVVLIIAAMFMFVCGVVKEALGPAEISVVHSLIANRTITADNAVVILGTVNALAWLAAAIATWFTGHRAFRFIAEEG
jgi:hypothetical protein